MHVLAQLGMIATPEPVTRVVQECNIGLFPVDLLMRDGQVMRVVMTQPEPQFLERIEDAQDLYKVAAALGIPKHTITDTKWPLDVVSIVPVRTLTAVRSINPDPSAIVDLCGRFGANGITAFTTVTVEPFSNVHSRMFAPAIGIPEDPATGSASGALGAYLVQNGIVEKSPKIEIVIEQGYEVERPSRILVQIESDGETIHSVKVGGQCVMVVEGTLTF
jgi:trans-2,3-dihydro-3-hydroxyanthranilate isomerase